MSSQATEASQMAQLLDIKSGALQELEAEVAVKRERIQVQQGAVATGRSRAGVAGVEDVARCSSLSSAAARHLLFALLCERH